MNYNASLEGLAIHGRAGDDTFSLDDNSAPTTIYGGEGADRFQVGQLFQSPREWSQVAAGDEIDTFTTTRGWLSAGTSRATTLNGGPGDDRFTVFHNGAALQLNGEQGDDRFAVRLFALQGSQAADPLSLGAEDSVLYAASGPLAIDGGEGQDLQVVTGTEFADLFAVTAQGVYGAGLSATYTGVESFDLDAAEGDDTIVVLGTSAIATTRIFGGLGSDAIEVGGTSEPLGFGLTSPWTLEGIQGALQVFGGTTAEEVIPAPVLYLGESDPDLFVGEANPNLEAVECEQVDTLRAYSTGSLADTVGTLSESRLDGLGLGPEGIGYQDLEEIDLRLGSGNDRLLILSTHAGATEVYAGPGSDQVDVQSIAGTTLLRMEAGNDTVNAGEPADQTVDRLDGLLVVDGGTGLDTLNVDDSGDATADVVWLTGTTLSGLDLAEALVWTVRIEGAAGGTFTLSVGGLTTAPIPLQASAAEIRIALLALGLPHVTEVTVNRAGDCFRIAFSGDEQLLAAALALSGDAAQLDPAPGAAPALIAQPAPVDRYQVLDLYAAFGTYQVTVGGATFALSAGASAADVELALLNALRTLPGLETAGFDDVAVLPIGDAFLVGYRGILAGAAGQGLALSVNGVSQVQQGQGSASFTLNAVAGTWRLGLGGSWTGPLGFDAGAAAVQAALNEALGTEGITVTRSGDTFTVHYGTLPQAAGLLLQVDGRCLTAPVVAELRTAGIRYAALEILNLDLGSGADVLNVQGTRAATSVRLHDGDDRIYVSNLASGAETDFLEGNLDGLLGPLFLDAGSGRHLLMVSDEAALAGDAAVFITDQPVDGLPLAEITISGLAPAPIGFRADAAGNFADGITLWSGWGADVIAIDGTHHRPDVRTVTTLNTGLGNDRVTVALDEATDGFFVLNTQGPWQSCPWLADADFVDGSASTLPLIVFGGQDADQITGGTGADILFGDRGRVLYLDEAGNIVTLFGNGGPGDRTDGVARDPARIFSVDPLVGGNDVLSALAGDDLVFGGTGADLILGRRRDGYPAGRPRALGYGSSGQPEVPVDLHRPDGCGRQRRDLRRSGG